MTPAPSSSLLICPSHCRRRSRARGLDGAHTALLQLQSVRAALALAIRRVHLQEMVQHNHKHRRAAQEDRQRVELVVGDHDGWGGLVLCGLRVPMGLDGIGC